MATLRLSPRELSQWLRWFRDDGPCQTNRGQCTGVDVIRSRQTAMGGQTARLRPRCPPLTSTMVTMAFYASAILFGELVTCTVAQLKRFTPSSTLANVARQRVISICQICVQISFCRTVQCVTEYLFSNHVPIIHVFADFIHVQTLKEKQKSGPMYHELVHHRN